MDRCNDIIGKPWALIIQISLCTLRRLVRPDRKKNFLLLIALAADSISLSRDKYNASIQKEHKQAPNDVATFAQTSNLAC